MNDQQETIIDGELVSTELDVAPTAGLFPSASPSEVLVEATKVADSLAPLIERKGLYVVIQRNKHITFEGWQTLGAMLAVTPRTAWTRQLDNGWEARVEVVAVDGRVIGAAESECLRSEKRWSKADDYAVRSMAQTRAGSKALASVLRWIMTLAGYSGTPADEMPRVQHQAAQEPEPTLSPEDAEYLVKLAWQSNGARRNLGSAMNHVAGRDLGDATSPERAERAAQQLTTTQADRVLAWIDGKINEDKMTQEAGA